MYFPPQFHFYWKMLIIKSSHSFFAIIMLGHPRKFPWKSPILDTLLYSAWQLVL